MNVLITGGTGLVGRALAVRLVSLGHRTLIATRSPASARGQLGNQFEYVEFGNGAEGIDLRGVDAVVHLAGEPAVGVRYTPEVKAGIVASRIDTAKTLTQAIARAGAGGPRRLLSASGVGFYGAQPGDRLLTESSPPGDDFLARVCVDWEREIALAEGFGVSTASLRLGVVLAPSGGALEVMARPFRMFVGGPIGSGTQVLSWVHLDDVVHAVLFLLDRPDLRGPFNLVAPKAVTNQEFSDTLAQALGRPALLRTPAFAMRALFGEGAQPILTGQRAVPTRLNEAGFTFRFPDLRGALQDCLAPKAQP